MDKQDENNADEPTEEEMRQYPPDSPQGVAEVGVTADEQREGEDLDTRLSREEPEEQQSDDDSSVGVGRITDIESEDQVDVTAEVVGVDVGEDDSDLSAEEAAMHIEEEPPERL